MIIATQKAFVSDFPKRVIMIAPTARSIIKIAMQNVRTKWSDMPTAIFADFLSESDLFTGAPWYECSARCGTYLLYQEMKKKANIGRAMLLLY